MRESIADILTAFALSFAFCGALIPFLRRKKAGQAILSYVKEHACKSGTPTMGGLAFIPAACLAALLLCEKTRQLSVALSVGGGYLLVGCLDDAIKIRSGRNLGLRAYQKILFQLAIALIVSVFCYRAGLTVAEIPFSGESLELGAACIPFYAFVFLAGVNCVNLTDGLDGLAAGTSLSYFLCFGLLISGALSSLCFCLVGALAAYLIFNTPKASVFMGDTGSLSLGGFVSTISVLSGEVFYMPLIGLPFVASGVSVILQVAYFKLSGGKRIFLMAPVHHHFQEKGFAESKISYCYALTSLLVGLVCLLLR